MGFAIITCCSAHLGHTLNTDLCALHATHHTSTEVEGHPFDVDTMLFMDWRDDHLADLPEVKARNDKLPTFLYAMPFSKNKVGGRHAVGSQPVLQICCLPFT